MQRGGGAGFAHTVALNVPTRIPVVAHYHHTQWCTPATGVSFLYSIDFSKSCPRRWGFRRVE